MSNKAFTCILNKEAGGVTRQTSKGENMIEKKNIFNPSIHLHLSNITISFLFSSPLRHLTHARLRRSNNLVAIQQTQGIKRLFKLSHCIHCFVSQLMGQVVTFDDADTVLARRGAFKLNSALDHFVHEMRSFVEVAIAVV